MNARLSIIGKPRGVAGDVVANAFELAFTHRRKVFSFEPCSRLLVQINGNTELAPHPLTTLACQRDALFHRDPRYRNEWDNVDGPHPGMFAAVVIEVD